MIILVKIWLVVYHFKGLEENIVNKTQKSAFACVWSPPYRPKFCSVPVRKILILPMGNIDTENRIWLVVYQCKGIEEYKIIQWLKMVLYHVLRAIFQTKVVLRPSSEVPNVIIKKNVFLTPGLGPNKMLGRLLDTNM